MIKKNLKALKSFVREKLEAFPVLRELILSEPDFVEPIELLGMARVWLRVFDLEGRSGFSFAERWREKHG